MGRLRRNRSAILPSAEVDLLLGDGSKAKSKLGWTPKTDLAELARLMVESDLELAKKEKASS